LDRDLERRWTQMNERMREVGVESCYRETRDLPRYGPVAKGTSPADSADDQRMYRDLAGSLDPRESEMALEFEEAALCTLGFAYEARPRLSGGAYHAVLKKVDETSKGPRLILSRAAPEFVAALPIAAADGTLEKRGDGARGRVRAKTGLLNHVTGLSGYARTRVGDELVFSIVLNDYKRSDAEAMAGLDAFAAALAAWDGGGG